MTVIAWDGTTLAADKQSTSHNLARTTTKIYRVPDGLVAITGSGTHGHALLDWFMAGRDKADWPRHDNEDECGNAIHVTRDGVFVYNGAGFPRGEPVQDRFMAFGSGRDFAMAAMYLGKTAREAAEIACVFDTGCGMGIDTLTLGAE